MKKNVDDLLNELKDTKEIGSMIGSGYVPTKPPEVDESNLNNWIIEKVATLVQQGMDISEELKRAILCGGGVEELEAYSNLLKSVASTAEVINKLNIQNKKDKSAKELQKMKTEQKKELTEGGGKGDTYIISTREEILNKLIEGATTEKAIDPSEIEIKD